MVAGRQTNIQKSNIFYILAMKNLNNKKNSSLTIASKRLKCLIINLTKEV